MSTSHARDRLNAPWVRATDDDAPAGAATEASVAADVAAAAIAEAETAAKAALEAQVAVRAAARAVAAAAASAARAVATAVEAKAIVVAEAAAAAAEARRTEARLTQYVLHDELTGLPRRRLLLDRLTQALARAKRTGTSVGVLYVDLDRFKGLNDTLGHAAGDQLLVGVAGCLQEQIRETDTCARVGGDEFVVVCEDVSHPAHGLAIVGRLATALAAGIAIGERTIPVRASIGVAVSEAGSSPQDLLEKADAAMYRVKTEGRSWEVGHVHGQRWAIVNRTGRDAVSVRLAASGSLLVFGVRDWTNTVDRWPDGVSVEVVAQTTWRRNDPPELSIAWSADDSLDYERVLTIPWPR